MCACACECLCIVVGILSIKDPNAYKAYGCQQLVDARVLGLNTAVNKGLTIALWAL